MPLFQSISGYYSSAKNFVTSTTQTIWKSDTGQAIWQGLTAPYNTYKSWKGMTNRSEELKASVTRSLKLNADYAFRSLISYLIYYRVIHAGFDNWSQQQDEDSWSGTIAKGGIATADMVCYGLMNLYLIHLWLDSAVQNWAFTSSTTITATKAMRPSIDFKPCDDCDSTQQVAKGIGESLAFYVGSRYLINKLSYAAVNQISGWKSGLLVFCLESAGAGFPLVEYKFSAAGRCAEHRYADIFSSHKMYALSFGASFVAVTWGSSKFLSVLSGADNLYIYDAVFSFMFQMYILFAISRQKKFPGNDKVTIDFVSWFNYLIKTYPVQFFLEKFLGELYSLEKAVQTPGVGLLLTVRDNEIKDSLATVKGSIQQVKDIQNSSLYTTAKWVSSWLPSNYVPEELKALGKSFSKKACNKTIQKIEQLLAVAKDAEEKRITQTNIENKVVIVSEPPAKSILNKEILTTVVPVTITPTTTIPPRIMLIEGPKTTLEDKQSEKDDVKKIEPEKNQEPLAVSLVVDENYAHKKTKKGIKPIPEVPQKRRPGLFNEKDFLQKSYSSSLHQNRSLTTTTAVLASRAGKSGF